MRSIWFILLFLMFVVSGCKKEKTKDVPETSCVCLKENIGVAPANHVLCYGFLTMTTYHDLTRDTPFSYVSTNAFFTSIPDFQMNGNAIVTVDSVCLNQQSLKPIKDANGGHMYYQNDDVSWPSQQEWSIYGANGIPTFTVSADVKNPTADFSLVPDNMSKSLIKAFKIKRVANITGGSVTIFSREQSGGNVSVILREGSNEICFPEEQLKLISSGKATVFITLENTLTKTFGNKNFAFSKKLQFEKKITLNP
jgi:hypothetical protein